jgi:hypothetical protein
VVDAGSSEADAGQLVSADAQVDDAPEAHAGRARLGSVLPEVLLNDAERAARSITKLTEMIDAAEQAQRLATGGTVSQFPDIAWQQPTRLRPTGGPAPD